MLWVVVSGCSGAQLEGAVLGDRPDPRIDPSDATPGPAVAREDWGRGLRAAGAPFEVRTDAGGLPTVRVVGADRDATLPLERTAVRANLQGFVADVEVSQTFANTKTEPIEVVYVFPLPENSAVDRMKMVIGPRTIEAEIKKRDDARLAYLTARSEGRTAALLEQERPNAFTQSVANIAPGSKIDVVVHYVQDLTYDAGEYEFVFPMVVAPRFLPGAALPGPDSGSGTRPDTDRVPDASRVSPPFLAKGQRSGRDVSLEVVVDAGVGATEFEVPTHAVTGARSPDGALRVALAERDAIANRDFVLRYRVAKPEPSAVLLTSEGRRGKYFSLVVQPPALDVKKLVGEREIVFVVDVSGSMSGVPLGLCKTAMRQALLRLSPVDTFNVVTFSGATGRSFERPRRANHASIADALAYLDRMQAGGGTEMQGAVAAALEPDVPAGRSRYVLFLTDGLIGEEDRIVGSTEHLVVGAWEKGRVARVFGVGIGSAPNRHLIAGLARAGRGLALYASARRDPAAAVNAFFRIVDRSVVRDLRVDWGDLEPEAVVPAQLPDLFATRPLVVHGRFRGAGRAPIVVHGDADGRDVTIPVAARGEGPRTRDAGAAPRDVLGLLWARAQVTELEDDQATSSADRSAAIEALGLSFGLVTRYTSFIAVDRTTRVGDGAPETIVQPQERPQDVDVEKAGGDIAAIDGPRDSTIAYERSRLDASVGNAQLYAVQQIRRRSCGCHVVGSETGGAAAWWWVVAAVGCVVARSSARRPPRRAARPAGVSERDTRT